ncbi:sporulation histidine kinase inhibitor Sda [Virgibacillus ihumii]|nr:sporulation histidine kinase inhibitor Sda [Virgibacillus ihumii]
MYNLSDELLLKACKKAKELNLGQNFIALLKKEIKRRNL